MDRPIGAIRGLLDSVISHFLSVSVWLILASWTSAFVGAIIYYVWQHNDSQKSVKGFFRYTFPLRLVFHRSTRMDAFFSVVNHLTEPFTVAPLVAGTVAVSYTTYTLLNKFLPHATPSTSKEWLWYVMLIAIIFVQDFCVWFTHFLEHKVAVLWEIHKVHHSLPVMTPLSNRRHHPWQLVWEGGFNNLVVGIVLGLVSWCFNVPILDNLMLGVDGYFIASVLSFYQLRHSHIPLHYGPLEKWFLSPAQHQLHHSVEPADWDKNFSLLLSIWDRAFKTITYTKPGYVYRIGLQPQYAADYDRVWKFFIIPPYNIGKIVVKKAIHLKKLIRRRSVETHRSVELGIKGKQIS